MAQKQNQKNTENLQEQADDEQIQSESESSGLSYLNVFGASEGSAEIIPPHGQSIILNDPRKQEKVVYFNVLEPFDISQGPYDPYFYLRKQLFLQQVIEVEENSSISNDPSDQAEINKILQRCGMRHSGKREPTKKEKSEIDAKIKDFIQVCEYDYYLERYPQKREEQPEQMAKKRRNVYQWIPGRQLRRIICNKILGKNYQPPKIKHKAENRQRQQWKEVQRTKKEKDFTDKQQLQKWRSKNRNQLIESEASKYPQMVTTSRQKNQSNGQVDQRNIAFYTRRSKELYKNEPPLQIIHHEKQYQKPRVPPKPSKQSDMQKKQAKLIFSEQKIAESHPQFKREKRGKQSSGNPKSEGSL